MTPESRDCFNKIKRDDASSEAQFIIIMISDFITIN